MRFSMSELQTWRRCRRYWHFSSPNALNLAANRTGRALWLGTGVHYALAEYHSQVRPAVDSFNWWCNNELASMQAAMEEDPWTPDDEQRYEELRELGLGMLTHYQEYDQANQDFVYVSAEQEFAVPLVERVHFLVGRFDGIVRDQKGRYWVAEFKTTAAWPPDDWLLMMPQITGYVAAARALARAGQLPNVPRGAYIEGALWAGLLKKVPAEPEPLISGGLTRARQKLQGTTYERYYDAIIRHGLNPRDYAEELAYLQARGNTYFRRLWVRRSDEEIAVFVEQLQQQAIEIASAAAGKLPLYPTPTNTCAWECSFTNACLGMQSGSDVSLELESNYHQRPPRGYVYDPENEL